MFGYQIFCKLFYLLDEKERLQKLQNIFGLDDISVYSIVKRKESIIFRFYSSSIFYQVAFHLNSDGNQPYFVIRESRFIQYEVFISFYRNILKKSSQYPFLDLVKIFLSQDEDEIISLFHSL